jgi:RNA polymerase sigma-70 factor (ECF subfamily)
MESERNSQVTQMLLSLEQGDGSAAKLLFPVVYDDLRALASRYLNDERKGHTLQPTALVHEAYMRLVDQTRVDWQGRTHFFAVGAQAMRRILVDHARKRKAARRGGGLQRITLDEQMAVEWQREQDILDLDDALIRLAQLDPQQAQMVELRFFSGLKVNEVAEVLGMSKRSVEREWTMARAWLRRELSQDERP